MKINLGCGLKKIEGFTNIDSDPLCNPDQLLDLETALLPFEDNTVDTVVAHYILECIGDNFLNLIKEIYRVCKDGAILDIAVTHPRHDNFLANPTYKRPVLVETMRQFSRSYAKHKPDKFSTGLADQLGVDFEILDFVEVPDEEYRSTIEAGEMEQLYQLSKRFNNVITETKMKIMVVK